MTAATVRTWNMRALWWGIAAAPAAWSLDELASLYVHESACNAFRPAHVLGLPATTVTLAVIGLLMAAVAASAVVTAWRLRAGLRAERVTGRRGSRAPDRP